MRTCKRHCRSRNFRNALENSWEFIAYQEWNASAAFESVLAPPHPPLHIVPPGPLRQTTSEPAAWPTKPRRDRNLYRAPARENIFRCPMVSAFVGTSGCGWACWRQNTRFSSVKSLYEAAVAELPGKKCASRSLLCWRCFQLILIGSFTVQTAQNREQSIGSCPARPTRPTPSELEQPGKVEAKSHARSEERGDTSRRHVVTWRLGIFGLPPRLTQGLQAC